MNGPINEADIRHLSSISSVNIYAHRKNVYHDTKNIVNKGSYKGKSSSTIELFDEEAVNSINQNEKILEVLETPFEGPFNDTKYHVFSGDCLDVALFMKKHGYNPILLNMACNFIPGGGVEEGYGAQEHSLFRRSNYFQHLKSHFYPIDGGIYSPNVVIFKASEADEYELYEIPEKMCMVAVAAIEYPKVDLIDNKYIYRNHDREKMLYKIWIILTIAAKFKHDCVILGAFGCGSYRNPPEEVALLFKEALNSPQFKGRFLKIIFATFNANQDNSNTMPFATIFEQNITYHKEFLS